MLTSTLIPSIWIDIEIQLIRNVAKVGTQNSSMDLAVKLPYLIEPNFSNHRFSPIKS